MSYFQEQSVNRIVDAIKENKPIYKKRFIEIVNKGGKRQFINIDYIEVVAEIDEERSYIYLAFNVPNAIEQDYHEVNIPYAELVYMILEGGKG